MKLLALDTATHCASVALIEGTGWSDWHTLATAERAVSTHSDVLITLLDEVLTGAGHTVAELDGIAVGAGPGSFTGLRIGLATAKGLCFAADKPLWMVSTLAALAADASAAPDTADTPDKVIAAVLDAKKDEVYVGCYAVRVGAAPELLAPELALPPAQVPAHVHTICGAGAARDLPIALVGTGVDAYPDQVLAAGPRHLGGRSAPSGAAVGRLALAADAPADLASAAPAYRRLSEAEVKFGSSPGKTTVIAGNYRRKR